MQPAESSLDDKYSVERGRVYLTGVQALIRLPMLQRQRDRAAGLDTAGFISGYRGSPLGNLDLGLWKARPHLDAHDITFQPAVNEDLAATAVWGTQQVGLFPGARHAGVFAMWYGKGPGVDRCGDVFRHANAAGTSRFGGVLAIAGDDHAAKSSTLPHQTEHVFKAVMMPVLVPANVQEYLEYGLHGWAMSRYSGCWVAFKALADTVETSASVYVDPLATEIRTPTDFLPPPDGLNIRWPDPPLVQEARLLNFKLYAALAYCRANRLNRVIIDSPEPRLGIITCGKSYLDVRQALDELGIDDALAALIGIRLYKVGMVWPLEAEGVRRFAEGLEEILVVEEKRQMLEYQLKEELYNWREDVRPRVVGKFDEKGEWALLDKGHGIVDHGEWLLPAAGELSVAQIARVVAARIQRFYTSPTIEARLDLIEAKQRALSQGIAAAFRTPYFCSGCPHNTSTRVPQGSRAVAGIGCHYMAIWMDRNTATFTHMGGEGVTWIGQAPFTSERHIFANLGDGTYYHSGLLAIRQAVAAFDAATRLDGAGITYKILFNDAVAMTGGQPVDGPLSVPQITRQLTAEGVRRIVVVTDDPGKFDGVRDFADGTELHPREAMDEIQRELRELPGVSVLIYDQTCATEKRRRRKRGRLIDPPHRLVINEMVCEGCGDCSKASNCLSVIPLETEFGRKRSIDQSSCNKDYSCLDGFCPSFVSIEGGRIRRRAEMAPDPGPDPEPPPLAPLTKPFSILVTGVGGTGVVTIGALVGMAAHLDGRGVSVLDMTGLAQKYGAVFSHIRLAERPEDLHAVRIATGEADAILGGDLVVSASGEAVSRMLGGQTRAVINSCETPTAEFARNPGWTLPVDRLRTQIEEALSPNAASFVDFNRLAVALLGDAVFGNLLLVGFAWQRGMIPVSRGALERAIELNGVAVAANLAAFAWGRRVAASPESVLRAAGLETAGQPHADGIAGLIDRRAAFLADYQDAALAQRYRALVARAQAAESDLGGTRFGEAVAHGYFKVLAIKDEYEVARLHTTKDFLDRIADRFEGGYRLRFHFVPPWARKDSKAPPRKRAYGQWIIGVLRGIAAMRPLRGGPFDVFGWTAERRAERALVAEYESDIDWLLGRLRFETLDSAVELALLPESIRGYGHVKAAAMATAARQRSILRQRIANPANDASA